MKHMVMYITAVAAAAFVSTLSMAEPPAESESYKQYGQEFDGTIAESYADSEEWWPTSPKPAPGTPNVIIFLLDDTGFAHLGSFGGLVDTPNIDRLAANGLRYNNFHTTALCSPSRAAIMAGRNHHRIGLGSHSLTAMGFPGYNAFPPESAKSVAKHLQKAGFVNYALGKWDHTPLYEVSRSGPFDRWPSGEGFDHFYGFMAADSDNYRSLLWTDHTPVENWTDEDDYHNYHLSEDMADKATEFITSHVSISPDRPFMMFWAPVAMHSPHQAPPEYIEKYHGTFDMGWDAAREAIHAKQLASGILPAGTKLSTRAAEIPAWDSLSPDEQKLYARQMEVFAAMLTHVDEQIGEVLSTLERTGQLDNTLIFVTADNGSSGEGGLNGTFNETYVLNGLQTPFDANMSHYDAVVDILAATGSPMRFEEIRTLAAKQLGFLSEDELPIYRLRIITRLLDSKGLLTHEARRYRRAKAASKFKSEAKQAWKQLPRTAR